MAEGIIMFNMLHQIDGKVQTKISSIMYFIYSSSFQWIKNLVPYIFQEFRFRIPDSFSGHMCKFAAIVVHIERTVRISRAGEDSGFKGKASNAERKNIAFGAAWREVFS